LATTFSRLIFKADKQFHFEREKIGEMAFENKGEKIDQRV